MSLKLIRIAAVKLFYGGYMLRYILLRHLTAYEYSAAVHTGGTMRSDNRQLFRIVESEDYEYSAGHIFAEECTCDAAYDHHRQKLVKLFHMNSRS